jgi:hypothetical protein
VNGESVNEALLAGIPVSPKMDFNNLSSPGFPFDCSVLITGSYCGYCQHQVLHCWMQNRFSSFVSTLDLESRKVVPDVYFIKPTRCNLYNVLRYYQRSTCFGRFFRPSSGAHKTVCAALGIVMLSCHLPLVWMSWNCSI